MGVEGLCGNSPRFSVMRPPIDDYPELIHHQHIPLLRVAIWVILVGVAVFFARLLVSPQALQGRIYSATALLALAVVAHLALSFRGPVATIRLLIIGSWSIAALASVFGEGVRSPFLIAYPIILVFSGWMLGPRYCIALFILSSLLIVGLATGQSMGLVGMAEPVEPGTVAIALLMVLSISAVMTLYLRRIFRDRYAEVRRLNQENIKHLKAAEIREANLHMLTEHIPGLVFEGDRDGRCVFANQQFAKFTGVPIHKLMGAPLHVLMGAGRDLASYQAAVLRGQIVEFVLRKRTSEGGWKTLEVTLVPRHDRDVGHVVGWYGLMYDVTRRELAVSELRDKATHDPLTGLANRMLLHDRLEHAIENATRRQTSVAVLFVDLDNFKKINDTKGHEAGDQVLREIAHRLLSSVRSVDTVARLGGDEFAMVIEEIKLPEAASLIADKILPALGRPVMLRHEAVPVGGSIGVAIYPDAGQTADELLRAADSAMYEAKAAGRNCYRIFENSRVEV